MSNQIINPLNYNESNAQLHEFVDLESNIKINNNNDTLKNMINNNDQNIKKILQNHLGEIDALTLFSVIHSVLFVIIYFKVYTGKP